MVGKDDKRIHVVGSNFSRVQNRKNYTISIRDAFIGGKKRDKSRSQASVILGRIGTRKGYREIFSDSGNTLFLDMAGVQNNSLGHT